MREKRGGREKGKEREGGKMLEKNDEENADFCEIFEIFLDLWRRGRRKKRYDSRLID